MSSLNASLYAGLASGESTRQAYAAQLRAQEELVGNQLKATLSPQPGSTVSARYEYKVGSDGTLYPTQTQITTQAPAGAKPDGIRDEDRPGGGNSRAALRSRAARFSDFNPVRVALSPLDQLALFATVGDGIGGAPAGPQPQADAAAATGVAGQPEAQLLAQAEGSNGKTIVAEILPPLGNLPANDNAKAPPTSLDARRQFAVATLYARNNDIVYNVSSLTQLAA